MSSVSPANLLLAFLGNPSRVQRLRGRVSGSRGNGMSTMSGTKAFMNFCFLASDSCILIRSMVLLSQGTD